MKEFMELYETVYRDLYRLAYYYLGNGADAEDAVQDTALAAWQHFADLKKKESFRAWIFQILVNVCRKSLRGRQRRPVPLEQPPEDSGGESLGETTPNLTERLELLELLEGLDEEERLIVLLSVLGGWKGEEIAQILKRRHSTVRSRYRRALKKLEQQLSEKEEHR